MAARAAGDETGSADQPSDHQGNGPGRVRTSVTYCGIGVEWTDAAFFDRAFFSWERAVASELGGGDRERVRVREDAPWLHSLQRAVWGWRGCV